MKIIDLRSDTVTLPTDQMRRAMLEAELGDDVYREDPTVNTLEEKAAKLLGKEAALFTVSGTMSNLVAVLTHTRRGDEIILGDLAHIFLNEVGGAAALGGVVTRTLPNLPNAEIDLELLKNSIRSGSNIHYPPTALLCLENTHNRCGGKVLSLAYTSAAAAMAHQRGLRVHLDGARIFNAAIYLQKPAAELAKDVDSVSFCLSKGLSAPVGSLLCGKRDFIDSARKYRKMLGGGMRQAGVLAAAGVVALDTTIERIGDDHRNAKLLAQGLGGIDGIQLLDQDVQTNIVIFKIMAKIPGAEFKTRGDARGILLSHMGGQQFRAVTHRGIDEEDIGEAIASIKGIFESR
jgi:threonine aldolase